MDVRWILPNVSPALKSHRRLLAIKMLLQGPEPPTVAQVFSITRRTLSRWIKRFNEEGIDGLIDRKRPGRPPKFDDETSKEYKELLDNPEEAGYVHWTARKFHGYIQETLKEDVGYSTLVRWLHEQNYCLKVPRPWPDRQDEVARQKYLDQLCLYLKDETVEIWFADEMGVEGDPRPRRRWVKKGSKPKITRTGNHMRMNVMGMVCLI